MAQRQRSHEWTRSAKRTLEAEQEKALKDLDQLKKAFRDMFATEGGKHLKEVLKTAMAVSQLGMRRAKTLDESKYHVGRADFAEELLSLEHGVQLASILATLGMRLPEEQKNILTDGSEQV